MEGYFFISSNETRFIIIIDDKGSEVEVHVYEIELYEYDQYDDLKNGEKIACCVDMDRHVLTIDIWGKYFFPSFPKDGAQWYHHDNNKRGESMEMEDFCELLPFTFKLAMNVTNIQTY